MPKGMGNPNSRQNLAWEAMCEDFEDELHEVMPAFEELRDALTVLIESNDVQNRYSAAHDVVNALNPDGEFGGAKLLERKCEDAIGAVQERMP